MESTAARLQKIDPDRVSPMDRRDPNVRRRMSGPAMRSFFNVGAAWQLRAEEQRALLGWPASSTFFKYKAGHSLDPSVRHADAHLPGFGNLQGSPHPVPGAGIGRPMDPVCPTAILCLAAQPALKPDDRRRDRRSLPGAAPARREARRVELTPPAAKLRLNRHLPPGSQPVPLPRHSGRGCQAQRTCLLILELETWTNDRISSELGALHRIPNEEWVAGRPMASVIMAAFCHPRLHRRSL